MGAISGRAGSGVENRQRGSTARLIERIAAVTRSQLSVSTVTAFASGTVREDTVLTAWPVPPSDEALLAAKFLKLTTNWSNTSPKKNHELATYSQINRGVHPCPKLFSPTPSSAHCCAAVKRRCGVCAGMYLASPSQVACAVACCGRLNRSRKQSH